MRPSSTKSNLSNHIADACDARAAREENNSLSRERDRRERVVCPRCDRHVRGKLAGLCERCVCEMRSAAKQVEPYDPGEWSEDDVQLAEGFDLASLGQRAKRIALLVESRGDRFTPHTLSTACEAAIFALASFESDVDRAHDYTWHAKHGVEQAKESFEIHAYECEQDAFAAGYVPCDDEDLLDERTQAAMAECDDLAWMAMEDAAASVIRLLEHHMFSQKLSMLTRWSLQGLLEGDATPTGLRWDSAVEFHDEFAARFRMKRVELIQAAMDRSVSDCIERMRSGPQAVIRQLLRDALGSK